MSYPCNIIQGKAKQFKTYKHAIAAYGATMAGTCILSQVNNGCCEKSAIIPRRRHLTTQPNACITMCICKLTF
jgi:hypothetical protein